MKDERREEWTGEKERWEGEGRFRDGNRKGEYAGTMYTYMTASNGDKYVKERKRAGREARRAEKERERQR